MVQFGKSMLADKPFACLGCGEPLTVFAGLDTDLAPEPGDIAVCLECGQMQIYDEREFSRMTAAEYAAAMRNDDLRRAVLSARRLVARRKRSLPASGAKTELSAATLLRSSALRAASGRTPKYRDVARRLLGR